MLFDPSVFDLIRTLVSGFVAAGKPVLPPSRRAEVVELLSRLMARPDLLLAYTAALEAERERRGEAVEVRLLSMAALNIEDERIARDGFAGLSDDQLADLAISPEAVEALNEFLTDPEVAPGKWFYDAVTREEIQRPSDAEPINRLAPYLFVSQQAKPSKSLPASVRPEGRHARYRLSLWVGSALALAASVLVAFFLGTRMRVDNGPEVLLAQAEVRFIGPRGGAERVPHAEVESSSRGFLTVVALLPGAPSRPVVIPSPFETDIPVTPGRKSDSGPFPLQARAAKMVLVVVTETPASGTIEKYLEETKAMFAADQAEQVEVVIRRALREKNFAAVAIKPRAVDPNKVGDPAP